MGLLGGVLTGLLGGSNADPTAKGGANPTPGLLGLPTLSVPGLPTLSIPGIPPLFPPTGSVSGPGSDSASASASASATSASATPISSSGPSSSSASPLSVSSPPTSSFTPTSSSPSAPPPTSLPDLSLSTGADGVVQTVSHVVTETASNTPTQSAAPAHQKSFLENKPLSGTVFALAGLVGLVLIVVLATWVFRRRRRNRLLDDAVSFDPSLLPAADRYDGSEKGHSSNASLGTLGSGRPGGYGTTYQAEPAQYNPYGGVQQPAYYGAPQPAQQYYGDYGAPQTSQQPYYSAYVPPMADAPPPSLAASTLAPAPASRATHNIPRVPVPAKPLPEEFGSSDQNNRTSIEESEFWAKTLKVTNE